MKISFNNILFVGLLVFLVACKKDNNNTPADKPAIIDITKPSTGVSYTNGTALPIEGLIIDDNGLSQARLEIRNKATGTLLNQQSSATGNFNYYNFQWTWTVTGMTATIQAIVKVISKDRYGYEASKELEITLTN